MYTHHKQRSTKETKVIERNKSISNNIFKSSLFVLAASVMFFSLLIIGFIIIRGIMGAGQIWDGGNWLFGNTYDGAVFFAAGFMVINTLWTSFIAVLIALPISVLTAIFITRVAPKSLRPMFFIVLSILAAIPSVIYGAFGTKILDTISMTLFGSSSGSLLTIVLTLAFMIMPTITLITTSTINSVDKKMEQSSLALGATRNQTSFYITIRAASTGILTATILGVGRAIGEATAVSMISVDPYSGPTFGLFENIRLLTSTMLKGYNEMAPGSKQQASMFAMGMLLIITILVVFLTMRYAQRISSPETKSKRATKKLRKEKEILSKAEELETLTVKDQKRYNKLVKRQLYNSKLDKYYHDQYRKERIITNTTIKKNGEGQKNKISKSYGILTWIMAAIGVIFLISIILFLLVLGLPGIDWVFISSPEEGVRTALFGTILLIVLSLLFIIPLGIGTGLYFSTFAKNGKVTRVLTTSIDILSGIPSLIFGLVGAALFMPMASAIGFAPLAGALILSLIVMPTVIQTTQEAIKSVPKSTVNGSLALGTTKTTSTLRIVLPQALPQIISGIVLSIGRIIGESAAIVMIFGTVSRSSNSEWAQFGGTTLATEMYSLTLLEEIPWEQVAAIGIIILSLILILALLSNYISEKSKIGIIGIIISILLIIIGIFVGDTSGLIVFILGMLSVFITIILNAKIRRK